MGERVRPGAHLTPGSARELSPKQAERARKRAVERRKLQIRVVAAVLAVAGIWGLWTLVSTSRLFEIRTVRVSGIDRVTESGVTTLAAIPDGATLLNLDTEAVRRRLAKDPWIASVSLSRRLPSTLSIRIRERVPIALVDTGVSYWYVDGNARVIAESVPDTSTAVPVIRDLPDFVAEPGVRSDSKPLANALAVLSGLDSALAGTVRTISAPSVNETALLTASNVEIMIGEATQLQEKSVLVRDILAKQGGKVVFIDVRSVERPISRGLK